MSPAVASPRPWRYSTPFAHQPPQFLGGEAIRPALADAGGNLAEEGVHQGVDPRLHVAQREVGGHQPHAAIDVVAHAARRDDAAFQRIGRADAADAEAVAPVDIGHGQAGHLDARQEGDVGHLLRGLVVADLLDELFIGEDAAFGAHADLVRLRDPPDAFGDLFQRAVIAGFGHGGVPLLKNDEFQMMKSPAYTRREAVPVIVRRTLLPGLRFVSASSLSILRAAASTDSPAVSCHAI